MLLVVNGIWNEAMRFLSTVFQSLIISTAASARPLPKPRLVYFDVKGLGQAIRDTFMVGEIDFVDERINGKAFEARRAETPYGQLPVLYVDDEPAAPVVAQSKSILRWASRLARTYPSKNSLNAAIIDQWCDLHTEFMSLLSVNMYPQKHGLTEEGYNRDAHRRWLIETHIPKYLGFLNVELATADWLGDMDSMSMADICWYPTLSWLRSGTFDGVNEASFEEFANVLRFMDDMGDQLESTESDGDDTANKKDE